MKKKIISLLLAVMMIVGIIPLSAITAFADGGTSETLTLRDILDTVGGTYSYDMSVYYDNIGNVTHHGEFTVGSDVISFENKMFADDHDGELLAAQKTQFDADGMKCWDVIVDISQTEYGDPFRTDETVTVENILNSEVFFSEDETTLEGTSIVIPAGSYFLEADIGDGEELFVLFCDMQNAKTQKLFFDNMEYTREVEEPTITVKPTEHGTVTVEPAKAAEGDTVTITVTPDSGYALVLNSLNVTYEYITLNVIHPTPGNNGTFTFTMPAYDVTVEAMFEEADMTLADIIGKIGGTYSSTTTDDTKQLTTKYYLGENKIIVEWISLPIVENVFEPFARKTVINKNGATEYTTYNFSGNTPQYGGIIGVEYPITIGDYLASGVDLTKDESSFGEITVPESSYYLKWLEAYFYDEVNNKTQKMCALVDAEYVVLDRIGDTEPLTLRDIIGTVGGTYSGINSSGTSVTITINSNEISLVTIYSYGYAERTILGNTGTKIWNTETFVNGQPVFDDEDYIEIENETIETFLNLEVEILTENVIFHDVTDIPAGSYVVGDEMVFYNEQNGVTQNSIYFGAVLNRIGDTEHKHTFSDEWSNSPTHHWHDASCEHTEFVSGFGAHTFGEGVTEGNKTTYTCTVCGYEKVEIKEEPVHEHTYSENWTCDPYYHWHDCICDTEECDCNGLISGFAAHTLGDGVVNGNVTEYTCSECGYKKYVYNTAGDNEGEIIGGTTYTGISLTLGSDIAINFYMDLTDEAREKGTMTFDIGGRIVTLKGTDAKYNETEKKYYFSTPLTALEMNETVKATFTYNGVEYVQEYSVAEYIETIIGNPDKYGEKAAALAKKIANYGHYAQIYLESIHTNVVIGENGYEEMFKCGDVDIDVAKAKEALAGFKVTVSGELENLSLYGSTVYFDSATALNYYVTVENGTAPTATAVNTVTGKSKDVEIKLYKDNIYIVSVKDITATELADDIEVKINNDITVTGSVFAYCNSVVQAHSLDGASDKDIFAVNAMAAFYEYYEAAIEYLTEA